jgi:ArsR family transcriptional regulator
MAVKGKKQKMSPEVLDVVAAKFKVMSEPLRLAILQSLMDGEKNVGQIQKAVQTSQPNVSKHLNLLDQAGLIGRWKEGVTVYYKIIDSTVFDLCDLVCSGLQDQFEAKAQEIKHLRKKVS